MSKAACQQKTYSPVVLVVDDEPDMIELFDDVIGTGIICQLHTASTMAEARKIIRKHPIDLLVADIGLPDGSGMDLLEELRLIRPDAGAMFMTGKPHVDQTVFALRHGVLDYLPKPFSADQARRQLKSALNRQRETALNERRLGRLRRALKKMGKSRRMVSKKVDLLCNDVVSAYGEIAAQVQAQRVQEGFRRCIERATDLEQLLCHAMDWILKEAGYSNIAVWLSNDEQKFELGAYMKYTIVGNQKVTTALRDTLVQATLREGFIHLSGTEMDQLLSPAQQKLLPGQTAISANCTYLGESLAVVTLFRDAKTPFRDEDATTLREIASIFSTQLATLVKRDPEDDDLGTAEEATDQTPWADGDLPEKPKKKKQDDADWWKRGDAPPF